MGNPLLIAAVDAAVKPYVASFDEMTVLKFLVTLREARTDNPAEVRRYFRVVLQYQYVLYSTTRSAIRVG